MRNSFQDEEAEEIRRFNRELYDDLRGGSYKGAIDSGRLKGGLYDMIVTHGYCPAEVATWIGVSRERVRQWMIRFDISRPPGTFGTRLRLWDDKSLCFRFVTSQEVCSMRRHAEGHSRKAQAHRTRISNSRRRFAAISRLREVKEEMGRIPTVGEFLARSIYKSIAAITPPFRLINGMKRSYAESLDTLWFVALGVARPDGRATSKRWPQPPDRP